MTFWIYIPGTIDPRGPKEVAAAHSIVGGSAWEPTVWRAVQRAGWDALEHAERNL